MSVRQLQQLEKLQQLSEKILQLANSENWEQALALEQEREHLTQETFSQPVAQQESEQVAAIIQYILQLNEQITTALSTRKICLEQEFRKFKQSRQASSAYLKHTI